MNLNASSKVQYVIQFKNGIKKHVDVNAKIILSVKKIIVRMLAQAYVKIASIWKLLLMIQKLCDEIIHAIDILSTNASNTIPTMLRILC